MKIKIGTSAGVARTFKEAEKFAIKNKFDALEVMPEFHKIEPNYKVKYTVHAHFLAFDISSADAKLRKEAISKLKECIILAKKLHSNIVVFHPCSSHVSKKIARKNFNKSIKLLLLFAKKYNILLGFENMDPRKHAFTDISECLSVIKRSKYLRLVLDLQHLWLIAQSSPNPYKKMFTDIKSANKYIEEVHISDAKKGQTDHFTVGKGEIDFERVLKMLKSIGYKGDYILEGGLFDPQAKLRGRQLLKQIAAKL